MKIKQKNRSEFAGTQLERASGQEMSCTLLTDGSSDKALLPILAWLFKQHCSEHAIQIEWADLRRLRNPPKKLAQRIQSSLELYPCDVLFVHRDAEKMSLDERIDEINQALKKILHPPPTVCVVPVRMHEAWLLHDAMAILEAVGRKNGGPLDLPSLKDLERLSDPKQVLHALLLVACGRNKQNVHMLASRVASRIKTYEPLRQLEAFRRFEEEFKEVAEKKGWLFDQDRGRGA